MDDGELRLQEPDDGELFEAEQLAGTRTVTVRAAGDVDLDEEDRRWLIRWLAQRTPGLHVIECVQAVAPDGSAPAHE